MLDDSFDLKIELLFELKKELKNFSTFFESFQHPPNFKRLKLSESIKSFQNTSKDLRSSL